MRLGSTAGVTVAPDGAIWAYDRCGAHSSGEPFQVPLGSPWRVPAMLGWPVMPVAADENSFGIRNVPVP
jgi:hypothetical protein